MKKEKRVSNRDYDITRWSVSDAGIGGFIKLNYNPSENQIDLSYSIEEQGDMISFSFADMEEFINDLLHFKKVVDNVKKVPDMESEATE